MQVSVAVIILSLTEFLIGRLGINGAGIAFVSGQAVVACVVFPSVRRQYRRPGMAPGFNPEGPLVVRGTAAMDGTPDDGAHVPEHALRGSGAAGAHEDIPLSPSPAAAPADPSPPVGHPPSRTGGGATVRAPGRRWRAGTAWAVLVVDVLALYAAVTDLHGTIRLVLGLALVLVVPGWSVVGLLRLADPMLEAGLTLAVSLALYVVAAQVLLTLHAWHLVALQEAVSVACIPLLLWQIMLPSGDVAP